MKKIIKSTLVVAVLAVSAAIGYESYNQYQNQQLAFANPLMEENIEALADVDGISCIKWKNTHIRNVKSIINGYVIYGDSVMGVCDPWICNSEDAIKEAKKHGYTANSGHSHGFMKCDVDLLKL